MSSSLIPLKNELQTTKFKQKNLNGKFCLSPFNTVLISTNGDVTQCGCEAWLPTVSGNLRQSSLKEILSNYISTDIRSSIIKGTYDYCDDSKCGIINQNALNEHDRVPENIQYLLQDSARFVMPYHIFLAGDEVCNLSCPSCRTDIIKNSPDFIKKLEETGEILASNLFSIPTDQKIYLTVSTSGEVFASKILLNFLQKIPYEQFPNLEIHLQTNGILVPKKWHLLGEISNRVTKFTVSVDSCTKNNYETLRRGASWEQIQFALSWISDYVQERNLKLSLRMVVQKCNYKEILGFYNMAKSFHATQVEFARILNWGTFSNLEFDSIDVFNQTHPDYNDALKHLEKVKNKPDVLFQHGL